MVEVAKLSLSGHTGADRVRFDGRIDRADYLPSGRYTVVISATAGDRTSSTHALAFTIDSR